MRPLELTLEGFKSYRKPQTFTFDTRTLFGIVGPTGSGKSSILEGLIFGLYGKTPSVESGTKKLINALEWQARVQLVFESDDVAWEVVRIIRLKGTSQTILRRVDGVGDPVTGDRNVTEKIEEIVGLDFESFRSSVVLPQGEFDRFLKATPTERSRILKGIFRLERVDLLREGARSRLQLVEGQISVHQSTLDSFPDQPEVRLKELKTDLAVAEKLLAEVRDELPGVLKAEQDVLRSGEEIRRVRQEKAQAETALRRLPPEESLRNLGALQERAERRLEEAQEALVEAARVLNEAQARETEVAERSGGDAWFAGVETGLAARQRIARTLAEAEAESAEFEKSFQAGAIELPKLEAAFLSADAATVMARARLRELEQNHAAHLLRRDLAEGQACPVCEQTVSSVPHSAPLPALSAATEAITAAEAGLKKARTDYESARTRHTLAGERLRQAVARVETGRAELDEVENLLGQLAAGVSDLKQELSTRRLALAESRSVLKDARTARDAADAEERKARRGVDDLAQKSRDVTNQLSHTSGLLGLGSISPESEGLWDAAKRIVEAGAERVEALVRRERDLEAGAAAAARLVNSFRTRFAAAADDQASDVLARAKAEVTRLELRVEEMKGVIVRQKEVQALLSALVARRKRFERLITDFADSKFTAFLLDEQRRLLSRIGSEKFRELTGHYRFDEEGQFQIVDERTGLTRSPDTLSGGETFLASLSLALALSEAVALEGGRLGCFFLDEGFGSLDQESLDLALEGIETLADPGRLIGLISHIPGVQARLDDLIILERGSDGSTEVVQHEGPMGYASMLV
ncbi:MAG TPA: SMC family ATPase [Actinomycetota bacterium]|nr:SMC family ATPase [Actinomycetota bacterium]